MLAPADSPDSAQTDETAPPTQGIADALPGHHLAEVKVFSATKRKDRETLGEAATEWLRTHDGFDHVSAKVNLSSDLEYHCLSITLLCWRKA